MVFIFVFVFCIKHQTCSSYLNKIFKEWFIFLAFKSNARKPEEKDYMNTNQQLENCLVNW